MTYVIAEPCIGTKDNSCVEVCPVDCIHPTPDEPDYDKVEHPASFAQPPYENQQAGAIFPERV